MTTLHSVVIPNVSAVAWLTPIGGNSRYLSTRGGNRWDPIHHAYAITRGDPPPMDSWERNYWGGWNSDWRHPNYGAEPLRPLCGEIPSRSRQPSLTPTHVNIRRDALCADCLAIAPSTTYVATLQTNDPWRQVPFNERRNAVDPVTGL